MFKTENKELNIEKLSYFSSLLDIKYLLTLFISNQALVKQYHKQ
jgi:hypothetical protein